MAPSSGSNSDRWPQVLQQLRDPVVRGIAYDHSELWLMLGFRDGRTVEYSRVPRPVYEALIDTQPLSWAAANSLLRRYRQR